MAYFDAFPSQNDCFILIKMHVSAGHGDVRACAHRRGIALKPRWLVIIGSLSPIFLAAQSAQIPPAAAGHGPYARIAIMRPLDGHSVKWEEGYIRHLEWHRQAKDLFGWYSYSVWASSERQRWIIYATFGHTAAELSNPVSPAEDERDNLINVLPRAPRASRDGLTTWGSGQSECRKLCESASTRSRRQTTPAHLAVLRAIPFPCATA